MARSNYSAGKRQREIEKAKRKKEKLARRHNKRDRGGSSSDGLSAIPIATVDELQGGLLTIEQKMAELKNADIPGAESTPQRIIPARLFVGGLDWEVDSDQLRQLFEKLGTVTEATVIHDRDTGNSRGFGFVTMDRRAAQVAIEKLHGTEFERRTLVVKPANDRK